MILREEAEQTVPVSCEVSGNSTSFPSSSPDTEALYQTGCLEMLAKVLGDNVVAVTVTCVSVMVIQVSRVTFGEPNFNHNDSQDPWSLFRLLSGAVCSSATLGILNKYRIHNI